MRRLLEARPTHIAGVRARFLEQFDESELRILGEAWERILASSSD